MNQSEARKCIDAIHESVSKLEASGFTVKIRFEAKRPSGTYEENGKPKQAVHVMTIGKKP